MANQPGKPMQKQTCPCPSCPKAGENYECADGCGFALTITADCNCADAGCVSLACCGKAMVKVS